MQNIYFFSVNTLLRLDLGLYLAASVSSMSTLFMLLIYHSSVYIPKQWTLGSNCVGFLGLLDSKLGVNNCLVQGQVVLLVLVISINIASYLGQQLGQFIFGLHTLDTIELAVVFELLLGFFNLFNFLLHLFQFLLGFFEQFVGALGALQQFSNLYLVTYNKLVLLWNHTIDKELATFMLKQYNSSYLNASHFLVKVLIQLFEFFSKLILNKYANIFPSPWSQ